VGGTCRWFDQEFVDVFDPGRKEAGLVSVSRVIPQQVRIFF